MMLLLFRASCPSKCFPENQQHADRLGRTSLAADSAHDCERSIHGNRRTYSHDADDEAGLQIRVKALNRSTMQIGLKLDFHRIV
jgi:hypothetical protein